MDRVTNVLDANAIPQDDAILKIRRIARLLGVHPNKVEVFPEVVQEIVKIELHFTADDDAVVLSGQPIYFFKADLINLVVNVEAGHVDSVAHNHIDEL
jgi:hypothetical protein